MVRPLAAPLPETPDLFESSPPAPSGEAYFDQPYRDFSYSAGVHVSDTVLWCDAERRSDLTFVSSAEGDHLAKNRRVLMTQTTYRLLRKGKGKIDALTGPYRHQFSLGTLDLTMEPAGFALGSAQLVVVRNNGRRLVYAAGLCAREGRVIDQAQPISCDALAVAAPVLDSGQRYPEDEEVWEQLRQFIDDALSDKMTPVLLTPPLGVAVEIIDRLEKAGYRLRLHRAIDDVRKVAQEEGLHWPQARRFQGRVAKDEVLLVPPILRQHSSLKKIGPLRTAWLSPRALDEGQVYRMRVDAAFPWTDGMSPDALLDFVMKTGAQEVYLLSGQVEPFAEALQGRGIRAYPLLAPAQLSLF